MTAGRLRRWLGEPTVYFLVLGAAVFAAYAWLSPARDQAPDEAAMMRDITVPAQMVTALRRDYAERTGASPSADELDGLINEFVDDEVLYREALSLGLDRHDLVVRRRLVQTMRFLVEDKAVVEAPTDDDLRAFIDRQPARYATPASITLTHVFLDRDRHGPALRRDGEALRARLRTERPAADVAVQWGDPFLRGHRLRQSTRDQIAQRVDPRFADAVMTLAAGEWSEAVESAYGLHFVWIDERRDAAPPQLEAVRDRALRDLVAERRRQADREALDSLRQRYNVRIEHPTEVTQDDAAAQAVSAQP